MDNNENNINIEQPNPVNPPVEPVQPMQPVQPIPTEPIAEPKKDHKARNIFIGITSVAVLAIGAAVTAVIIDRNNSGTEEEPKTSEQANEAQPLASSLKLTGSSLSNFDLEFLKLENKEENKIYSPLSIKYALAMLKDGATGDSKTQIENLVGDYAPKAYLNSENRSLANAIAINETYKDSILPNYVNLLQTKYYAEVIYDPFRDASAINQWVSDQTLGIINDLLDDDFNKDNDKMFALINALAIDMDWNNKIQCSDTVSDVPCKKENTSMRYAHEDFEAPSISYVRDNKYESMAFNAMDNSKAVSFGATINNYDIKTEVGEEKIIETLRPEYQKWLESETVQDYVSNYGWDNIEKDFDAYIKNSTYLTDLYSNYGRSGSTTDFSTFSDDSVKVFAKDLKEYDGDVLQYVAIMPKQTDLKTYVDDLTAENVADIISELKNIRSEDFKQGVITKITGQIPLFDFSYELKLKDDLQSLGITNVFDANGGGLLDMTDRKDAFIADAIHKANIEFSNEGIKAAAVTVFMGGLGAAKGPTFEYLWDVPVEEIDLTFDKPFLFLIRDKNSGEVWFTGTVYEPQTN